MALISLSVLECYLLGVKLEPRPDQSLLKPIYTIVACDFYSARYSCHGKIICNFHDIKLPVATIVIEF